LNSYRSNYKNNGRPRSSNSTKNYIQQAKKQGARRAVWKQQLGGGGALDFYI
jgi:hypothetical protein